MARSYSVLSICVAPRLRGAALILLVFMISLMMATYQLYHLQSGALPLLRDKQTSEVLAEAKLALIGYAISYDDTHPGESFGYLPCPDTTLTGPGGEGAQLSCGSKNVSVLGKLPWKTLDLAPLRDGAGECLWYAVSGSYKNNPKTDGFSPETPSLLQVFDNSGVTQLGTADDPVVAVIFAPGPVLHGQNRQSLAGVAYCSGNYSPQAYLDRDVASGIDNASITSLPGQVARLSAAIRSQDVFNDRLTVVTRSEIFSVFCQKYARQLQALHEASCNASSSILATCVNVASKLADYCAPQSCRDAAIQLTDLTCLQLPYAPVCQQSMQDLASCRLAWD